MGCLTFELSSMKKNSLNQIFVIDLAGDSWQFHSSRATWCNRYWRKFSLYFFLTLGSKNEVRVNYSWFGLCILIIQMIHGYICMQEIQAHRGICTKIEYPVFPFLAKLPTQSLTNINSLGLPPVSFYNWCVVKYIYIYFNRIRRRNISVIEEKGSRLGRSSFLAAAWNVSLYMYSWIYY